MHTSDTPSQSLDLKQQCKEMFGMAAKYVLHFIISISLASVVQLRFISTDRWREDSFCHMGCMQPVVNVACYDLHYNLCRYRVVRIGYCELLSTPFPSVSCTASLKKPWLRYGAPIQNLQNIIIVLDAYHRMPW